MHSSRMRTIRNSSCLLLGGLHTPPESRSPRSRHLPQSRHPKGVDPPGADTPRSRLPCCKACWDTTCNACWDSTPPCCKACWDTTCNACWDSTYPPASRHAGIPPAMHAGIAPPPTLRVDRITDTCKNITFATSLRTVKMQQRNFCFAGYYFTTAQM